jgi:hypothetical protein
MDALTLAQQIVDVVRQSGLDVGRAHTALHIAQALLDDEGVTRMDAYTRDLVAAGGISSRSTST